MILRTWKFKTCKVGLSLKVSRCTCAQACDETCSNNHESSRAAFWVRLVTSLLLEPRFSKQSESLCDSQCECLLAALPLIWQCTDQMPETGPGAAYCESLACDPHTASDLQEVLQEILAKVFDYSLVIQVWPLLHRSAVLLVLHIPMTLALFQVSFLDKLRHFDCRDSVAQSQQDSWQESCDQMTLTVWSFKRQNLWKEHWGKNWFREIVQ